MRICKEHWDELQAAVRGAGMWHLVSEDGQALASELDKQVKGEKHAYDPLNEATLAIYQGAIDHGGLAVLGKDADGNEYCALCLAKDHTPGDMVGSTLDEEWIEGVVKDLREYCEKHGLINVN